MVGLVLRPGTLTGTLFLDGKPLLDGVPLVQGAWAGVSPDIIVRSTGTRVVRVEDLKARYKDLELKPKTAGEEVSQALVKDSFEGYPTGVFPDQGGWRSPGARALGLVEGMLPDAARSPSTSSLKKLANSKANSREGGVSLAVRTEEANRQGDLAQIGSESALGSGKAIVDEEDSVTGLKSFRIETDGKDEVVVAKRLSLPSRVPFGVSEGNFVIGVAKTASPMRTVSRSRLLEELSLGDRSDRSREEDDRVSRRKSETANEEQVPGIAKAGHAPSGSGDKTMKLMSASPVGNFYIYSFDGKLLQMYDVFGTILKDYIYMGDRLIAEYDHVGARFLYYTPDQINTTRVVTDGSGTIVYSAAHDPYGGIQQTDANNTYDPQLKFSGKERDAESGLDYFGARYYDKNQYRFISIDNWMNSVDMVYAPNRWNLYSYCGNSPITFLDPTGGHEIICYVLFSTVKWNELVTPNNSAARGVTEPPLISVFPITDENGKPHLAFVLTFEVRIGEPGHLNYSFPEGYGGTFRHEMQHVTDVSLLLNFRYAKIERDWKKGRIDLPEAQNRAEKARDWAVKWSRRIWDSWGSPFGLGAAFLSQNDPFWLWVDFWQIMDMQLTIVNANKRQ